MKNKFLFNTTNIISFMGTNIFLYVVSVWLIKTTGTPSILANIMSLSILPLVVINMLAGYLSDRFNKKYISIASDIINGSILLVAYFTINDKNVIYVIGATLIILRSFDSIYSISMKALIKDVFFGEDVKEINTAYSLIRQISTMIGPYIGSVLLLLFNYKFFLLLNSASYIISSIFTLFIETEKEEKQSENSNSLLDGWKYFFSNKLLMANVFSAMIANFFLSSVRVLLPYIALIELNFSESKLSMIMLIEGLGAISAPLIIKVIKRYKFEEKNIFLLSLGLGLASMILLYPTFITLSLGLFLSGMFITIFDIYFFTNVNDNTVDNYIGRIVGIIFTFSMLSMPIGIAFWGNISLVRNEFGLLIVGVIATVITLIYTFKFKKLLKH